MSEVQSYHDQDYYELLEVSRDATRDEIEAAYLRLKSVFAESSSATYMLFGDDEAATMRDMLDEAFRTLSDDGARVRYDDRMGIKRNLPGTSMLPSAGVGTSSTTPIMAAELVEQAPAVSVATAAIPAPPPSAAPSVAPRAEPIVAPRTEPSVAPSALPAGSDAGEATTAPAESNNADDIVRQDAPVDALADNMEYSGGVLARVREARGVQLESIAQRTKISLAHLRAIEANQYDKLPARVYVRGFVTQYAKFLALPADKVAESYLQIYDRFFQGAVPSK